MIQKEKGVGMKYFGQKLITVFLTLFICSALITGCSSKEDGASAIQKVSFVVADDDESTITYCEDHILSASGNLSVTNHSEFPVTLLMVRQDKGTSTNDLNEVFSISLEGRSTKSIESIDKGIPYEVGCRTTATEGIEIEVTFKDC